MVDDQRVDTVKSLLFGYVRSPSLRHIRDPHSVIKLANEIVKALDRGNSAWKKWDGPREILLKSSLLCWVPLEDMRAFLNQLPGPQLTRTDVEQRLKAFQDEEYFAYPKEELQAGCLAIYEAEKAAGTELPAIVGALQDFVEREEERLRKELDERNRERREEERIALEQRFLSGADCKWTPINRSDELYCRINGREYRLTPTKDKMWTLDRIASVDDNKADRIGKYRYRGDANKVLAKVAYEPELRRWR